MALNKKSGFDLEDRLGKNQTVQTQTSTLTSTPIVENRSKRLYATIQPSMYDKLDRHAAATGRSLNELVNAVLKDYIRENKL